MIDLLNDYLYRYLGDLAVAGIFFIGLIVFGLAWACLEKISDKKWNTFIKIILCIPIWFFLNGGSNILVGIFFRDFPSVFYFYQYIAESALIVLVFFKAIPSKGNIFAIVFAALYAGGRAYLVLIIGEDVFSLYEKTLALASIATAVIAYTVCEAVFNGRGILYNWINKKQ